MIEMFLMQHCEINNKTYVIYVLKTYRIMSLCIPLL